MIPARSFSGKTVAIFGLARTGLASARALKAGGANVIAGTTPAAGILALIQTGLTASYGQLFGQIGLLVTVIVVIRLMPQGLGNLFTRSR